MMSDNTPPPMPSFPPPARKKRTKLIIISVATTVAAGVGGLAFWLSQPTYDDHVKSCMQAVKERPEGDKSKPGACDELKKDDYNAVVMNQVIGDLGWTDEDGNFDKNEMIEDGLNDTP
jgi:hypothetical protein